MKRALAERAKAQRVEQNRTVLSNTATPPSHRSLVADPPTSTQKDSNKDAVRKGALDLDGGPPRKIPKIKSQNSAKVLPEYPRDTTEIHSRKTTSRKEWSSSE